MSDLVRSDVGQHAILPMWIVMSNVSPLAIRLFAVLHGKYSRDDEAWPSRRALAEDLRVSVSTIDRSVKELVAIGAIEVEHREDPRTGDPTSNLYLIRLANPTYRTAAASPVTGGGCTSDATPLVTDDEGGSRTREGRGSRTGEGRGSRTSEDLTTNNVEPHPIEPERGARARVGIMGDETGDDASEFWDAIAELKARFSPQLGAERCDRSIRKCLNSGQFRAAVDKRLCVELWLEEAVSQARGLIEREEARDRERFRGRGSSRGSAGSRGHVDADGLYHPAGPGPDRSRYV